MPTSTQLAFGLIVLVVGPGAGVLRALEGGPDGRARLKAAVTGAAMVGAPLALFGILAARLYPRYPVDGPGERFALLFVLPALIGAAYAVAPALRIPDSARRRRRLGSLAALLLLPVLVAAIGTSSLERHLPLTTFPIRVFQRSSLDFLAPDFTWCMKAPMTAEQFEAYVARLELEPGTSRSNWDAGPAEAWWDPPRGGPWYGVDEGKFKLAVAWRDGTVYVSLLSI